MSKTYTLANRKAIGGKSCLVCDEEIEKDEEILNIRFTINIKLPLLGGTSISFDEEVHSPICAKRFAKEVQDMVKAGVR